MDITSRRNLWDILKKIVQGKIVILTTHFMEEAQILGDRIGILSEGKMQVVGTPLELIDKYTNNVNLNIIKHADANEDKIIGHVLQSFGDLDIYFENFNRNILFRIPTNVIEINWKNFFELLDRKLDNLKIKSYEESIYCDDGFYAGHGCHIVQTGSEGCSYSRGSCCRSSSYTESAG
jgi:ATP-binding cassette subfamily A (ABC1) protein 3